MTTDDAAARSATAQATTSTAPAQDLSPDWAAQTAATIDRVLADVRRRTTVPIVHGARGVVFGLLVAILGVAVVVLFAIIWVRVLGYLPSGIWVAHLITGVLFCLAGAILMAKRRPPNDLSQEQR